MKNKVWIIGPCSMESRNLFFECLGYINSIMEPGDDWYMKASFDKANRTSLHSSRGPGLEQAIEIWEEAKDLHLDIKLTTDIHECWQVEKLVDIIDVAQIPAFLSRQTDLIVEAAKHFPVVNIKKGQWMGPESLMHTLDKVKETNPNCEAWVCDRGSNFGYHELFVNFGIVDELKQSFDKVILDCTHATQRSRSVYGTQGDPVLGGRYLVAADIFNYDGVFVETHPRPKEAVSDGENMIPMDQIKFLINKAKRMGGL